MENRFFYIFLSSSECESLLSLLLFHFNVIIIFVHDYFFKKSFNLLLYIFCFEFHPYYSLEKGFMKTETSRVVQ